MNKNVLSNENELLINGNSLLEVASAAVKQPASYSDLFSSGAGNFFGERIPYSPTVRKGFGSKYEQSLSGVIGRGKEKDSKIGKNKDKYDFEALTFFSNYE